MVEIDWSSLHRILSDPTRRNILQLLTEKEDLSYTEIMTLLQIRNTGKLNYHLKTLGSLLSKDAQGKYRLTEKGALAANMLKTFPERIPEDHKKRSILKTLAASLLVFLGIFLIVIVALSAFSIATTPLQWGSGSTTIPNKTIPENTTVWLNPLTVQSGNTINLRISWVASIPISIYVLNSTQYDELLVRHSSDGQIYTYLSNFTGVPTEFMEKYSSQTGNASLSLTQGEYYFFAGSNNTAFLNFFSFETHLYSTNSTNAPVGAYLALSFPAALGLLMIVLAVLIFTRRIWR